MTERFNEYKINETDHTKFGGFIYPSDFNIDYRGKNNINGSTIASRIIQDQKFDKQCIINKQNLRRMNDVKRNDAPKI